MKRCLGVINAHVYGGYRHYYVARSSTSLFFGIHCICQRRKVYDDVDDIMKVCDGIESLFVFCELDKIVRHESE